MQKIAAIFLSAILLAGAITIASPMMINEAAASGKDKKDKKECYRDDSYYDKDHRYYEMCKEHYEECEEYYQDDKKHRDYRKGGQYYEECKAYYEYTYKEYNGEDRKYVEKDDRKVKYDPRDKKDREYKKYEPRDKKYGPQPYDPRDKNGKDYKYDEERQNGDDRQYIKYDPKPDYKRYDSSKKYGKYYEDPYEPKQPPMKKKVVCEDSGFIVNNINDCPVKCPDGLFVMQGMTCPEIPESFPVCDNGIVVNSTEFCPVKCPTGPFEGFYVMNVEQCPTMNGGNGGNGLKLNQTICESCILMSLDSTNSQSEKDFVIDSMNGVEGEEMNMWEICASNDPVDEYAQIVCNEGDPVECGNANQDRIIGTFIECMLEAELIDEDPREEE